jgi:hypothetical protein
MVAAKVVPARNGNDAAAPAITYAPAKDPKAKDAKRKQERAP